MAYETPLQRDRAIQRLTWMARFLDNAILIPGLRFRVGYDAIIGLVPGIGDLVTTAMSLYVVYEARRLGCRGRTIALMLGNVALDLLISEVPALGDVADFFFKSNTRNLALLGRELGIEELSKAGTGTMKRESTGDDTPPARETTQSPEAPRKHVDNLAAPC
ncbi:MAG: DUF4112 domain-containing protein [Phycisphaerales bacterium]